MKAPNKRSPTNRIERLRTSMDRSKSLKLSSDSRDMISVKSGSRW